MNKELTKKYTTAVKARRVLIEKYDISEEDLLTLMTSVRAMVECQNKWAELRAYNAVIQKEIFELQTAMTEETMAAIGFARPGCTEEASEYADMKAQHIIKVYSKKIIALKGKLKKV